ncbi:glycosyltransferase family 2 protein [Rhodoblastus acidophilus]|uniref:Glycosyltransferase family 2 protein n=1 Tax=Candidatus Rhodoblastus alkanivorans TaxID=2954117 RepID=A0ABS9Z7V7_9HYPH|nr:glycosyltransferase family 2 protein [Candidatus Rhodoblastus alkanivorans]MCI4679531.1 glycosyltransferase family 2 protein [Candidatus Rhodoblastus alkanivorans]MCI4683282.1 glycosyltransferase family 2 protein [Candidatus Rhodoblastus alkanivorans]MDI4640594.1 glycosyltransferase family 2 protein [Rhodoblastus acidophilus]
MIDLAVIILTFNEEKHVARAISSVAGLASEIFVIDSGSTDRTANIARALGATVLENKFVNYAKQFQWALDHAPIHSGWIMRLDADEILEPELVAEIAERLPALPATIVGVNLRRRHVFLGRWIRHGGRYPLILLRIFRRGRGRIENRWMDEHLIVRGGSTIEFRHDFSDANLNDLSFFTDKHNRYATREAIDVLNRKYGLDPSTDLLSVEGTSRQASLKRAVKEGIYNRLPLWAGPLLYFLYRYIVRFGFLDGREGAIYHFLQGFWYRFLVAAKVEEYERALRGLDSPEAKRKTLEQLTGHRLESAANLSRQAAPLGSGALA